MPMPKWTEKTYYSLSSPFSRESIPELREQLKFKGENIPGPYPVYDKSLGPMTGK